MCSLPGVSQGGGLLPTVVNCLLCPCTAFLPFLSHFLAPFLCFLQINKHLHSNLCAWPVSGTQHQPEVLFDLASAHLTWSHCTSQTVLQPHCSSLCFLKLLGFSVHAASALPRPNSVRVHLNKRPLLISPKRAWGSRTALAPNVRCRSVRAVDVMVTFRFPFLLPIWSPWFSTSLVLGVTGWAHSLCSLDFSWAFLGLSVAPGLRERLKTEGESNDQADRRNCVDKYSEGLSDTSENFWNYGWIIWIQLSVSSEACTPIHVLKILYWFFSQLFVRGSSFISLKLALLSKWEKWIRNYRLSCIWAFILLPYRLVAKGTFSLNCCFSFQRSSDNSFEWIKKRLPRGGGCSACVWVEPESWDGDRVALPPAVLLSDKWPSDLLSS